MKLLSIQRQRSTPTCFAAQALLGCALVATTALSGYGQLVTTGGITLVEEGPLAAEPGFTVPENLATFGIPFALDELGGPHTIAGLNDQAYGNSFSWISGGDEGTEGPFAGIDISPSPVSIQSFAFGRDNTANGSTDRTLGTYTLQYTAVSDPAFNLGLSTTGNPNSGWATIGTLEYGAPVSIDMDPSSLYQLPSARHRFNFDPVNATGLRLLVPNTGTAIDEIEIYSTAGQVQPPINIPGPIEITPAAGFNITWDGNDGDFFDPNAPPSGSIVPDNLALASNGAVAFTSSDLGPELGIGFHVAANINDGFYGNSNSWIGGDPASNPFDPDAFAGVSFGQMEEVRFIAFGRDNGNLVSDACGGQCTDRSLGEYTLQFTQVAGPDANTPDTANASTGWQTIGTIEYNASEDGVVGEGFTSYLRHQFEVSDAIGNSLQATGIRLLVPATGLGGGTAIDELEVFSQAVVIDDFTWNVAGGGNWQAGFNWSPVQVPNAPGLGVTFGDATTDNATVFTDQDVTVGSVTFDNANSYNIAGLGTVQLDATVGNAGINVVQGNHQFQAAVLLVDDTDVDVASGAQLDMNNLVDLGGRTLTKDGPGTLNINNRLTNGSGSIVVNDGTVGGSGSIGGNLTVNAGAGVAPGNSPGKLIVEGNFTLNGGDLNIELAGLIAGVEYDVLEADNMFINGGTLVVSLIDGFTPTSGDTFDILDFNSLTGTFFDSLVLPGGLSAWDTSMLQTNGTLTFLAIAELAGDYNGDGVVNAADYTVWRDNLGAAPGTLPNDVDGGVIGQAQYNTWKANFGATASAASFAAVPEPATCLLLAMASLLLVARRRRAD